MEVLIKMWGRTPTSHEGVLFIEEIDLISERRVYR